MLCEEGENDTGDPSFLSLLLLPTGSFRNQQQIFGFISYEVLTQGASQAVLVVKSPPASARDVRDMDLIPGLGRSPGGGHGNPLQYSCLENPMDRGAWWATVHGIAKSWTRLKQLIHTHTHPRGTSIAKPASFNVQGDGC